MGRHVLIAEDERNIIESLTFVLSREGYRVSHAMDGGEVLGRIHSDKPDALVLDLMLPKRSGFEILKDVRADVDLRGLPVLMLTAKGQSHDRKAAEDLGVDAFVTKPFANADVIAELARILQTGGRAHGTG